ncbi:MAG: DUF732 domain-containing protein [Leptolyngbyaceae bacterium]|nr:DUF732 domain-containing protein [Leptolyngbyaceae bacterium]
MLKTILAFISMVKASCITMFLVLQYQEHLFAGTLDLPCFMQQSSDKVLDLSYLCKVQQRPVQQPSMTCFMQQSSGKVLDLSYLCKVQQRPVKQPSLTEVNRDQLFLNSYRQLASSYPADLRDILLETAQDVPENLIRGAKNYCRALSSGLSPSQIQALQAKELALPPNPDEVQQANAQSIILENTLAILYYCPQANQ